MDAKKYYVKCRFLDENGLPKGREYTYVGDESMKVCDLVCAPTNEGVKQVIVTAVDVDESEVAAFLDRLKTVTKPPIEPVGE